jgi:NADH:ubiquinone oxidoreductase subunit F (NADH-binding)
MTMTQSAPPLSADEKRWRMVTATMHKNGYAPDALTELSPNQVIEQITRSGLRGRGGAGYPTWLK